MQIFGPIKLLVFILVLNEFSVLAQTNCVPTFNFADRIAKFAFNTLYYPITTPTETRYRGYTLDTSSTTDLLWGEAYPILISSYYSDSSVKFAAWIDYNNDSLFSDSELVFSDTTAGHVASGIVTIPKDSSYLGLRRIRILYGLDSALSSCGKYSGGECRDYWLNIVSTASALIHDYCIPVFSPDDAFPIDNFRLGSILNQHSGWSSPGYTFYPDTISYALTTNLKIGESYPFAISKGMTAGVGGAYALWIDLNNDGLFALQERLFYSSTSSTSVSGYITIPNDPSYIGLRRLRVMSINSGDLLNPCMPVVIPWLKNVGEIEDYTVRITPDCKPPSMPGKISGDNHICLSGSTQIYSIAPVAGATYYKWTLPQGWAGHSEDTFISVTVGNKIGIISVSAGDGCGDSRSQIMAVQPSIDTSVSKVGLTLTSNTAGAIYQWINCETLDRIPDATKRSYTVTTSGSYAVIITKDACVDTSACYTVINTGVKEIVAETEVTISPNPTIQGKTTLSCSREIDAIEIYNWLGERMETENEVRNQRSEIDLSHCAPGMYILQIRFNDSIVTKKIINNPGD